MCKNKITQKIFFPVIVIIAITVFFLTGCNRTKTEENNVNETRVLEIRERMFMTQVDDIYLNSNNFLGRTIKLEGIFLEEELDRIYQFVFRYAPGGCCGTDGRVGFMVKWPENSGKSFPANNSWVEAIGVLKSGRDSSGRYLYLELNNLYVSNNRGLEFVER